jgi:hypothetical protein
MLKNIISKSLSLTWRKPSLWFWGFLSALLFFSANDLAFISILPSFLSPASLLKNLPINNYPSSLSGGILILIIIFLLGFLFLTVFAEIKLIISIAKSTNKFNGLEEMSKKKKVRMIFLIRALEFFVFLLFWIPVFLWASKVESLFSFIFMLLTLMISLVCLFIVRYTIFYVLLMNQNFASSFLMSWKFLKANLSSTLKLSFVLFLLVLVYGFIWLFIVNSGAMMYPLRLMSLFLTGLGGNSGFWISFLTTALIGGLIQFIFMGFIVAFQTASWVLFFSEKRVLSCE